MGQAIYPVGITRAQGETLSLSSTLASLGIPPGFHQALVYVPSTDFRMHINPALLGAYFYDASAAEGSRWVNLLAELSDRDTATGTGSSMNSMTTSDFVYLGFSAPISGVRFTIGNANAVASTPAAAFTAGGTTWTTLTISTDGTDSGGATFAVTGTMSWTTPTTWVDTNLALAVDQSGEAAKAPSFKAHWIRFSVSATQTNPTSVTEVWSINRDTLRGYFRLGQEYPLSFDRRVTGAIELVLASGTDTAEITWVRTAY